MATYVRQHPDVGLRGIPAFAGTSCPVSGCPGIGHTKWETKWHQGHQQERVCPSKHPPDKLPNRENFPELHNAVKMFFQRWLPRVILPPEAPLAQCNNFDRCQGIGNSSDLSKWSEGHIRRSYCPISKPIKIVVPQQFESRIRRDLLAMNIPFPKCPVEECRGIGHTKLDLWSQGHVRTKDCPLANKIYFLPDSFQYPDAARELPGLYGDQDGDRRQLLQTPNIKMLGLAAVDVDGQTRNESVSRHFAQLTAAEVLPETRPSKRRRRESLMNDNLDEIIAYRKKACEEFAHKNSEFHYCGCLGGKRKPKKAVGSEDEVICDKCDSFWHLRCAGLISKPRNAFHCPVCKGKWADIYTKVFH